MAKAIDILLYTCTYKVCVLTNLFIIMYINLNILV